MKKTIIIVVLAIVALVLLGYILSNNINSNDLTPEQARVKAEEFINKNLLQVGITANVDEITELSGLYKISVSFQGGTSVDSYMSKDLKFFFPEGIDVEEFSKPAVNNLDNNQMELGIEVLSEGTGEQVVKSGDTISVDYTGTLEDGTQFDSSIGKAPFEFTIGQGQVIQGWDQGLIGMKVGEERKLTIPSALAYGSSGSGIIPPDATLIFTVKLISIN